jgi:polyhydroxyalkanoate synthesis repressor PhaR
MASQTVLIKKYENRRLYDATNSRYVNLEEVAQLVQQGYDVQVVDAASGEDITRLILTQIIAEGAKTADSNFPLDILRQMVIASGRAGQESAIRYTKAMLDLYQSTYRAMVPTINPFDFLQNPLPGAEAAEPAAPQPTAANSKAPASAASPQSEELTQLKARLAELEKAISSIAPQKPARPPAKKPRKPALKKAPSRKK